MFSVVMLNVAVPLKTLLCYLGENAMNLIKQKGALNITISLGYFIFSKNHNEPPKVAQLVKSCSIWSPCLGRRSK